MRCLMFSLLIYYIFDILTKHQLLYLYIIRDICGSSVNIIVISLFLTHTQFSTCAIWYIVIVDCYCWWYSNNTKKKNHHIHDELNIIFFEGFYFFIIISNHFFVIEIPVQHSPALVSNPAHHEFHDRLQ